MKRSGRTSIVIVATVAMVAAVVGLFLLAGDSPGGVTGRFLTALAKGDSRTLSELSYIDGLPQAEMEKKWTDTYEVSKYFTFAYQILDTKEQDKNNATVKLDWVKNAMSGAGYAEKYEMPLIRKDGKWKVDVRGISREMYPNLPR